MTIQDNVKVGKKGEILPKKLLREVSGINPGDEILIMAYPGELIVKKVYTIEELLEMPTIAKGTPKSLENDIIKELNLQEKLTNEEH